jgi:hypothetical protein
MSAVRKIWRDGCQDSCETLDVRAFTNPALRLTRGAVWHLLSSFDGHRETPAGKFASKRKNPAFRGSHK